MESLLITSLPVVRGVSRAAVEDRAAEILTIVILTAVIRNQFV